MIARQVEPPQAELGAEQAQKHTADLNIDRSKLLRMSQSSNGGLHLSKQDVLQKFLLPGTERKKVLKRFDQFNLNAFTLFEAEEALLQTLALRHIDFAE